MEKLELAILAQEVTRDLEYHTRRYRSEGVDFQIYDAMWNSTLNVQFFNTNVKKAVFTLAYLFRAKCRALYNTNYVYFIIDSTKYKEFLLLREIPKDRYFLHFLMWISFAFEMTMCCYREEFKKGLKVTKYEVTAQKWERTPMSYIYICKLCIEKYPNMAILADRERDTKCWEEIQKNANHIAAFHDTLTEALGRSRPKQGILPSFQVALKNILKLKECKLTMTEINMFRYRSVRKYYRRSKLQTVSEYHPDRIVLGHTVVRRNERAKPAYLSSKSSSRMAERGHSSQGNVQMMSSSSTSSGGCNVDVPRSNVSDDEQHFKHDSYIESAFVMSRSKRYRVKEVEKTGIRDIKIYLPQKEIMGKVQNLYTVLKEHVKKPDDQNDKIIETFSTNREPGKIAKRGSNPIIVMDSSEEEEEDYDEPLRRSFVDDVLKKWKEFSLDDIEVMDFAVSSRNWVGPATSE